MEATLITIGIFVAFFFLVIRPLQKKYGASELMTEDSFDSDIGGQVTGRWDSD
jgi:hypothetical protein